MDRNIIKYIIYLISILSFCFITYLIVQMLPIIVQTGWQGVVFLLSSLLLFIAELVRLVSKGPLRELYSYNLFIIVLAMYLSLIYYRIYNISPTSDSLYYNIDIRFCKYNYLIVAIAFLMTIFHLFFLRKDKKL